MCFYDLFKCCCGLEAEFVFDLTDCQTAEMVDNWWFDSVCDASFACRTCYCVMNELNVPGSGWNVRLTRQLFGNNLFHFASLILY